MTCGTANFANGIARSASLIAFATIALAGGAAAESTLGSGKSGQVTLSAHLTFQLVIPSVIWIDSTTGTVYSNDRTFIVRRGRVHVEMPEGDADRGGAAMGRHASGCDLVVGVPPARQAVAGAPGRSIRAVKSITGQYGLVRAGSDCVLASP